MAKTRATKNYATQQRHRPTQLARIILTLTIIACFTLPTANAYAAWFVDRRVSCMTDLTEKHAIIMNNGVLPHSVSREPSIRLQVSPLKKDDSAEPNSEYVVQFLVPDDARASLSADVQYVLELVGSSDGGGSSSELNPPAKFTSAPPNGGIGCEGRRSHGKVGTDDSAAILTINDDAPKGARLEITAGWATGHEAVTLTDKVVVVVGQGVVVVVGNNEGVARKFSTGGGAMMDTDDGEVDDALVDDAAEAELEELFIEEEREDLENEIESAEADAVEALEEKRIETDGLGSEINDAEEVVFDALEENRKNVNQALDSLKDEIMLTQVEKQKKGGKHPHNMAERREAQHKHREHHDRHHMVEDKLEEMHRRFQKEQQDPRKDKLDELMNKRGALKESVKKLQTMDKKEHDKARRAHIKPLPKAELKLDMEELKQHAKERMQRLSDTLGVNELMNEPHMKQIRGKLKKGLIRGGEGVFHGEEGKPLPPEGRHFLFVFFTLFGLVGLVRWYFDKKRRARKGRRNL